MSGAARTSSRIAFSAMRSCSPSAAASTAARISTSFEIERHRAGIDRGEIEDVVDDREQRARRLVDVVEIVALLFGDRPDGRPDMRIEQQMREADDVGERRAQLVGDVLHEIALEPIGVLQRVVALDQRALDIHAVGHVLERHQRRAVGQRHGRAIDHAAVEPFEPRRDRLAPVDPGDGAAQLRPERRRRHAAAGTSRSRPRYAGAARSAVERLRRTGATCRAKAGLCRSSRPSLPNTATPSASASSVSPCTRISAS